MLISFCIPTYNRASYLHRAIRSLLTYQGNDIEIIVQDNCSPDNTYETVKSIHDPRIRYFLNEINIGGAPNTMKIINNAASEYIYYLTDDDFLFPDSVNKIISFIDEYKPGCFSSDIIVYMEKSKIAYNYSACSTTGILPEDDNDLKAKVILYSHVISRLCFKKDLIPNLSKVANNLYPQMYMMGYIINNHPTGYLATPVGIHTWENETFWGIDPKDEKLINYQFEIFGALKREISPILLSRYAAEFCREKNYIYPELKQLLNNSDILKIKKEARKNKIKKIIKKVFNNCFK